jgi:hypothetical protein
LIIHQIHIGFSQTGLLIYDQTEVVSYGHAATVFLSHLFSQPRARLIDRLSPFSLAVFLRISSAIHTNSLSTAIFACSQILKCKTFGPVVSALNLSVQLEAQNMCKICRLHCTNGLSTFFTRCIPPPRSLSLHACSQ